MARKVGSQTGATPPARVYDPANVSVMDAPPSRTGAGRTSSIPAPMLAAMVEGLANGWVTNGEVYETKQEAQRDASKFKRGMANADGREESELSSRTWQNADGGFVFAIGEKG